MTQIPKELREVRQWTHSYSLEQLKRPAHHNYLPNGGLTYAQAATKAGTEMYTGFYTTSADPYILIDVDHITNTHDPWPELPVSISAFLRATNTYSEVSPSGRGLRAVCKLPSATDKDPIDGNVFYLSEAVEDKREVQCNLGPPWMTITGNATPFSCDSIAEISLNELADVFSLRFKVGPTELAKQVDITKLPSLAEVNKALMSIPLTGDPRIRRAYMKVVGQSYAHYDFWLRLLMALHNYATLVGKEIECLELAILWSKTDEFSYESEDDVLKHWRSFAERSAEVSYKTIFGISYGYRLFWPTPKKQTKSDRDKNRPFQPMISEYNNFKALVDYYALKLYRDEGEPNLVYVGGDTDILGKYFTKYGVEYYYDKYLGPFSRDTLIPAFHIMCQDYQFIGLSHAQVSAFVKNLLAGTRETVNLVRLYFDTPYDQLPESYREDEQYVETTTFEYLFESLKIDYATPDHNRELELYKAYYKKWLMGLVRNMYYRGHRQMNNCVLLLTGREQIRKTSHFRFLLPPFLRNKVAFTTHGFKTESSIRDVSKLSATNLVLVWDELEQYLNSETEPHFKKIIDGNPQKVIDKYETIEKTITPIAVYGATSNHREFRLGSEGSRRLFHIPVSWVDTDRMSRICWHKLFTDLRAEVEWNLKTGVVPWLLTEEQLEYQAILHSSLRAKTNIDMMLEEVFEFELEFDVLGDRIPGVSSLQADRTGRIMSTKEVFDTLAKAGFNMSMVKRPALVKTLERVCGSYTRTSRKRRHLIKPRCEVLHGLAVQSQFKKWIMPPMRSGAMAGAFKTMATFN